MKMKSFLVALLLLALCPNANAQETRCVNIAGNLTASAFVTLAPVNPTFAELSSAAAFSTFISVVDDRSASHSIAIYFFKTAVSTWTAQLYADGAELGGGTSGTPVLLAELNLAFTAAGGLVAQSNVANLSPSWSNGSTGSIAVSFNSLIQFATPSNITGITTNCGGEPPAPLPDTLSTVCISLGAKLNRDSSVTTVPIGTPTYAQLDAVAHLIAELTILDSLLFEHTLKVYYFKTADHTWTVNGYVDGSEVTGGTSGIPSLVFTDTLTFGEDGNRTDSSALPATDSTLSTSWSSGASASNAGVILYPSFEHSAASTLLFSNSDCSQTAPADGIKHLDFDGDKVDDFAIFRPSLGLWAIRKSSDGGLIFRQCGVAGDYPMVGDYTGDRVPDLVVWRPTTGVWHICNKDQGYSPSTTISRQFGLPGDSPIRGDFDGDGILDVAVWRPSNGSFYYRSSANSRTFQKSWGLPGDIPLVSGVGE